MWWEGLPVYVVAGLVVLELVFYAFFGATVWRIVGRGRQEEPKPREED